MDMFLAALPDLLFLLLVASLWLVTLAIVSPGTGVFELLAALTLTGAGAGMFFVPLNAWALIPIVLGLVIFILVFQVRRWQGWLLLGAASCFSVGSIFLFQTETGLVAVHPLLAIVVILFTLGFYWFAVRGVLASQSLVVSLDPSHILGATGETRTEIDPVGTVFVEGELWSAWADEPIAFGVPVRVCDRKGLMLKVEPAPQTSWRGPGSEKGAL